MKTAILEEAVLAQENFHGSLLTESQAGSVLKLSNRTLQAWRVRGCGPKFVKVGRSVRYRFSDLEKYLNENAHHSTSG